MTLWPQLLLLIQWILNILSDQKNQPNVSLGLAMFPNEIDSKGPDVKGLIICHRCVTCTLYAD